MLLNNSLYGFILSSGPIVKTVMIILLLASIFSWVIIFQRGFLYYRLRSVNRLFEDKFWSGNDMSKLYAGVAKQVDLNTAGIALIFQAGFKEYVRNKQHGIAAEKNLQCVDRAMGVAYAREQEKLEQFLPILATIGSISPYVGLFGTVWGIMTAFQALGQAQQATIAMVAPGIAEALIATAIGLFAAIPAVIAYNRYVHSVQRISNQYINFKEEFTSVLDRKLHSPEDAEAEYELS